DGTLDFTEQALTTSGLTGEFLGGAVKLTGGMGSSTKGLQMQGRLQAKALSDIVNVKGMERLSGSLSYKASLQRDASGYTMGFDSDLIPLAIDLPAPAGKPADRPMSLK